MKRMFNSRYLSSFYGFLRLVTNLFYLVVFLLNCSLELFT